MPISICRLPTLSELVNIRPCDKMILYIPRSKINQLRKGDELIIARTRNPTCPVAMLESYLTQTKTQLSDQSFLFRQICKTAKEESLRK